MLEKFENKYPFGSIACYLVVFIVCILLFSYGAKSIADEYRNSTERTISKIKEQQRTATKEADNVGSRIDNVGQAVQRADEAISNSEERAKEIAGGIERSKSIIDECKGIVEENGRIFSNIEASNRERAE